MKLIHVTSKSLLAVIPNGISWAMFSRLSMAIVNFSICGGGRHEITGQWDLLIAFPPCTYISNAGACRLYPKAGHIDVERYKKGLAGIKFFKSFLEAKCERIAVENPIPGRIFELPNPSQTIHPYMFGHPYTKATCLWLKGLPTLRATDVVRPVGPWVCGNVEIWKRQAGEGYVYGKEKSPTHRAKTFPGIAEAMADQWGREEYDNVQLTIFDCYGGD